MALFSGSIRSDCLGGNTWIQVATPDHRDREGEPKRVVYVLHGTTGHSMDWIRFTRVPLYASEYDVVFVVPEIGNASARDVPPYGRYFSYLVDELPMLVQGFFGVSDRREDMAIVGNSSGGYSALKCALARGDRFGLCAGFSPGGLYLDQYLDWLRGQAPASRENPHLHGIFGPDLQYNEDDILLRLAEKASARAERPSVYLSVGNEDDLADLTASFADDLAEHVPVRYESWFGGHDWYFWDDALRRFLDLYYGGDSPQ